MTATANKTGFDVLRNAYFTKRGFLLKQGLTETMLDTLIVRMEDSNRINFKASVAALNEQLVRMGLRTVPVAA